MGEAGVVIGKQGRELLAPTVEINWWKSLWQPCEEITDLYADEVT